MKEWDIDGFKLDFIDSFRIDGEDPALKDNYAGRDVKSVPRAVDILLSETMRRLRALKPDILIEFRQSYIGPAVRKYGNMFRAGDCPADVLANRVRTIDLRLTSGKTAVHSDMLEWNSGDTPEHAALQLLHVLFSVPQISVRLNDIPEEHRRMLHFWLDFCVRHRDVLLKGYLKPFHPELNYPIVSAENGEENVKKTVVVSIMPCTAKKAEIRRPEHFTEGEQDVDYVLTTTEITRMIQEAGIDLSQVKPESLDMPFGLASGAGAIFGVTGGVTEAVLRRLVGSNREEDLEAISFTGIRGVDGIKEAQIELGDRTVKIAVVNGLHCAKIILDRMEAGEAHYDFVEVMACKRGCIAGGGQPVPIGPRTKKARLEGIYKIDNMAQIRLSNENPIVASVYDGILKGKEHKLLHNE